MQKNVDMVHSNHLRHRASALSKKTRSQVFVESAFFASFSPRRKAKHVGTSRSRPSGFGDLDLKKGVDYDLKSEKREVWNKI